MPREASVWISAAPSPTSLRISRECSPSAGAPVRIHAAMGRTIRGVSADEVRAEIAAAIAAGASQMGPIMKALRDKFGAGLDGKTASELAKEALAKT